MIDDKIIMAIVGIIGGLIAFLQKVLYGQGKANYAIIVKLIDRFNKSDERFKRMEDSMQESAERRHEKLIDEINDLTDDMNFIKGRINNK
jgi:alcohol dehydrogenase class IV